MSCLALCITADSWVFVLEEVAHVLMVGGRLEFIDDQIFFPYRKVSATLDSSNTGLVETCPPRLNISIPSASFTTFSIYNGDTNNPGLGLDFDESLPEDFYELYGVKEETDIDNTATQNGHNTKSVQKSSLPDGNIQSFTGLTPCSWTRAFATSGDLEALFQHILFNKFGIRKYLGKFVLNLMKEAFGHAREIKTVHITLAPPDSSHNGNDAPRGCQELSAALRRQSMGLLQSPGLVLWPSTFIPMHQAKIKIHMSKHLCMLLSCKSFLLEHAVKATDDKGIDEESVLEAFWKYKGY
ncbi:hypothetical protein B0H34DRAFT_797122 [Crassisporium funariophilum]|nr:hypothetical protein B0H34DRAFT_797122 [Crassisporium funariophilum]